MHQFQDLWRHLNAMDIKLNKSKHTLVMQIHNDNEHEKNYDNVNFQC